MIFEQLFPYIRMGQDQVRPQSRVDALDQGYGHMAERKRCKGLPACLAEIALCKQRDAERGGDGEDSPAQMRQDVQNIL